MLWDCLLLVDVSLDVVCCDSGAGEDKQALDDIAELSDVSCPGLVNEEFHRLRLDLARLHAGLLTDLSHEMVYQKRDVLLALIQSRNLDDYDAESMVQVFSECSLGNLFLKILVGCSYNAHIHNYIFVASYS